LTSDSIKSLVLLNFQCNLNREDSAQNRTTVVLLFSPPCGLRSKRDGGPRSALVIFSITDHFVIGEKRSNVLNDVLVERDFTISHNDVNYEIKAKAVF
jgi:hypothetical protein